MMPRLFWRAFASFQAGSQLMNGAWSRYLSAPPRAFRKTMLPPDTFKGKIAFVTGGGTGLGKAVSFKLSELGAVVVIASRNNNVLQESASAIQDTTANKVFPIQMDVRKPEAVKLAVDTCIHEIGLPHVIINNAAGNFICPSEKLSANAFRNIVDIVLNGSAYVTLEFGKRLIEMKQGCSFLSVTTTYTEYGSGYVVPSAAAKAGLEIMTRSLASEWGKYGMRFNCIAPGPIETKGAFSRLDPTGEFKKNVINRIPIGRLGEAEEFANLVTYMVSDYSNWMTGTVVTLDGGELPFMAGEFNDLSKVDKEMWEVMERSIRAVKGS